MPTRLAVRQAVFDNDTNRKLDNGVGVIGLWGSDVCAVDIEVFVTLTTIMDRISQGDLDGMPVGIAEMMQFPVTNLVPGGEMFAIRTTTFFSTAGTIFDFRLWQIVGICDAFGRVRQVLTGARHSMILLDFKDKTHSLTNFPIRVNSNSLILLLQCRKFRVFPCLPWLENDSR
jgi:hypothetical protein